MQRYFAIGKTFQVCVCVCVINDVSDRSREGERDMLETDKELRRVKVEETSDGDVLMGRKSMKVDDEEGKEEKEVRAAVSHNSDEFPST